MSSNSDNNPTVYKICHKRMWEDAENEGVFTGAPVDLTDGFIHLSTEDQMGETAARHFAGKDDLVLIAIDVQNISNDLRWETSRGGDLFPHLYGDLPVKIILWKKPLPLGPDGAHLFPELDQ